MPARTIRARPGRDLSTGGRRGTFRAPAERLDPVTLEKLELQEVRCTVDAPAEDGTSLLSVRSLGGDVLFQHKVWIRSAAWARMLREH